MPETQESVQDNVQNTQEKQTVQERTKELTDRLEAGMTDLFQSEKYAEYLKSMSHFHNYSSRNIMLINMQMPGATRVASFKLWEEKFNRHVKKGEHGIRIFAPIGNKPEKKLMEKLDPETGAPLLDANGKVIMEEMTALTNRPRFKLVPVFDQSQTYGDPLPELVENLTGNVAHYEAFLDALKAVSTLPIEFEPLRDGHDGYCRYGEKIGIREGMSEIQTVAAIVHELAHSRLHDKGLENADVPKFVKELQAESTAYVFCQHHNIETAPNSFGYLASWGGRDMKEFKASLDTIRKESSALISAVDDHFKQICQDRGIDLTAKKSEPPSLPETPPAPEFATETRTENIAGVDFTFEDIIPQAPAAEQVNEAAKEPPSSLEPEEIMPDPAIGVSERDLYGYTFDGILPLTKDRALELYDQEAPVYLLYDDNTEAMAFDRSEIENFGGIFGIDRDEWQRMVEYTELSAINSEAAKESELIHGNADTYGIYQLRSGEELHYHRFASLEQLEKDNIAVDRSNYELVYTAPLPPKETLDEIHQRFNTDHPKDFTGHSLSVSDVVVIQRDGEVSSHYVDSFGFSELPAFLGNERQPERAAAPEQTDNAALNDIHERVKQGESVPLMDIVKAVKTEDNKAVPDSSDRQTPDNKPKAVYMQSPDHARENNELDRYRESLKLNKECAGAIDAAIKDCIVPDGHGYRLTPEAVSKVVDAYGERRVSVVLANTVRLQEWDGRYSAETKAWAKNTEIPQVRDNRDYFSASHPAVLDGYIRLARKETEKKPSILEAIKQGAEKSREQPEPKPEAKKSKEMEM